MYNQPDYICFLSPDDNTKRYYILDSAGNSTLTSFFDGQLKPLKVNPGGLQQLKISFIRNIELDGVNRVFTDPLTFIADSEQIIKNKFYATNGGGTEIRIRVLIFAYNSQPLPDEPTYQKVIDLPIDFFKYKNSITGKGFTAGLLDGGFMQAYTAYAETELVIPCDGSIPQNKRIFFDGMRIPDVLNYQFSPSIYTDNLQEYWSVPCYFVNNENDNYGIVKNDPGLTKYGGGYNGHGSPQVPWGQQQSPEFLFYADKKITVRVSGIVTIGGNLKSDYPDIGTINIFLSKDDAVFDTVFDISKILDSKSLVPNINGPINNTTFAVIKQQTSFSFDQTIDLEIGEKLYMVQLTGNNGGQVKIISGEFQMSFSSYATPTRCWGITLKDAMAYLVAELSKIATSATGVIRNYTFDSALLDNRTNFMLTSGAAIQASGNPDYGKYYRIFDINPSPNNNLVSAYGPVIKISFKDLFQICKVYCFGGLNVNGNAVSFVPKGSLWDSSNDEPYDIGEGANAEDNVAEDYCFTGVKVGAKPISFDQKAGNYDFNTIAQYVSTLLAQPLKYLDLTAPCCTSPFAFEKWRAGVLQVPTSITNNDNDNTTCLVNVDINQSVPDIDTISFLSSLQDFNLSPNGNIRLQPNLPTQPLAASTINGSYLSLNNYASIFVMAEPNLAATKVLRINYHGTLTGDTASALTGLPADFIKVEIVINGFAIDTKVFTIGDVGTVGPQLHFTNSYTLTSIWAPGYNVFIRTSTSFNAGGQFDICSIVMVDSDGATPYWSADSADIQINPGTPNYLLPLTNITSINVSVGGNNVPVVTSAFQYYTFNSILASPYFSYNFSITQWTEGPVDQTVVYSLFKNGNIIGRQTIAGTPSQTLAQNPTVNFPVEQLTVGDVFFIIASTGNLQVQITKFSISFTSSQLICYPPLRVEYDVFSGAPNLALNDAGKISTAIGQAPYNIEGITWARIMDLWSPWLSSMFFDQPNGVFQFVKADKNEQLYTSYQGKIYKENNSIRRVNMAPPMYLPRTLTADTEVQIRFNQIYKSVVNQHMKIWLYGVPFYVFPIALDQDITLNSKQNWKFLISPKTDLNQLINLNYNAIKYLQMADRSIRINYTAPVMFVAQNRELPAGCHFFSVDQGLITENLHRWFEKIEWFQPWQIGDTIDLQNWVKGLTPTTVEFYRIDDDAMLRSVDYAAITTNGAPLDTSIMNMEVSFDTTGLPECNFYLKVNAGGDDGSFIISNPMELLADQPDTLLIKYGSKYNTQGVPFTTGYRPSIRVRGNIQNTMVVDLKVEQFTDDEQDVSLLGAVPFEGLVMELDLMPDRMVKTLNRIFSLDDWDAEGISYTRAVANGKLEKEFDEQGLALRSYKIQIQESINRDGYDVVAGEFVEDSLLTASFHTGAWGNNDNNETPDDDSQIADFEVSF